MVLPLFFTACTTSKQMSYLYNLKDTTGNAALATAISDFETPIQKNDQLWITIGGSNLQDLLAINSGIGIPPASGSSASSATSATTQNPQIMGYLVEGDGTIKLPYLNRVKAGGLTRLQLENYLTEAFKPYTKNPVVNVRFLNYKVTVLGDVQRPGTFSLASERITLLEALGMAGDLTVQGKRESVLVVREVDGKREFGRVNLVDKNLFLSPYYYLRTNDVVYVESAPAKYLARESGIQLFTMAASGLSLLITILTIAKP